MPGVDKEKLRQIIRESLSQNLDEGWLDRLRFGASAWADERSERKEKERKEREERQAQSQQRRSEIASSKYEQFANEIAQKAMVSLISRLEELAGESNSQKIYQMAQSFKKHYPTINTQNTPADNKGIRQVPPGATFDPTGTKPSQKKQNQMTRDISQVKPGSSVNLPDPRMQKGGTQKGGPNIGYQKSPEDQDFFDRMSYGGGADTEEEKARRAQRKGSYPGAAASVGWRPVRAAMTKE